MRAPPNTSLLLKRQHIVGGISLRIENIQNQ